MFISAKNDEGDFRNMKIERDGDTIRYQDNQEDGNSVIIGGVIAPIVAEQTIDEKLIGRYWDYCAGIVKPCGHSIQNAIEWLEGNWDLESLSSDDRHMADQRSNIAMNRFPEKYGCPNISPEMIDEEIAMRIKEGHTRRQAALETTDEQLGIRLRGYRILDTPRNQPLYDEGHAEFERRMTKHSRNMRKAQPDYSAPPATQQAKQNAVAYLFIEETEAWVSGVGVGAEPLCRKLWNYIGISKEDIEARTPRFMGYVFNLAKKGNISTLQEFCDVGFTNKC